jgi:glyoxylase-like metal-dependent hydrolase (beta-lactamase superfamily II)
MEVVPGLHWVERIWDTKVYVLIEDDRVVLIDAAMPGRSRAVWDHVESLGFPPDAVDEIWITHGDIDHMGSVAALKAASGARVVSHRADAPLIDGQSARELGHLRFAGAYQRAFDWFVTRALGYEPASVDQEVDDGDHLGGWQVVHVPGHTPGSVCYHHSERGIAIVGDAVNHRRGRLGAPPRLFTPDMAEARASVRRIATLDFEVCCFGHGPPLLKNARERVQALADSLPGADDS